MTFFLVDDQLTMNKKVLALIENEGERGAAALGLWVAAGSFSQAKLSDGLVTTGDAVRLLLSKPLALRLAGLLVRYGLFDVVDGGWQIHDFGKIHRQNGDAIKNERERRAELKRPEIVNAVKARDGERCRYCGRKVSWSDRKSDAGACYDHVDPGLIAGASNLVVSCRRCNSTKGQRTPEDAGMTLLPPPQDLSGSDQIRPPIRADSPRSAQKDLGEIKAKTTGPRARARAHTPGLGMGLVREGSGEGPAGSGPGPGPDDELGVTVGAHGETGRAGAVPPGSVPPPQTRPQATGSPWFGWEGPPPDVDEPTCHQHPGEDLPCRKCARNHYAEEATTP